MPAKIGERYADTLTYPRVVEIVGAEPDGRHVVRVVNHNFRKMTTRVKQETLDRFYKRLVRLPVSVEPSNKGCRDAYGATCACPDARCWYGYAKSRHAKGDEAMDYVEWLAVGAPAS